MLFKIFRYEKGKYQFLKIDAISECVAVDESFYVEISEGEIEKTYKNQYKLFGFKILDSTGSETSLKIGNVKCLDLSSEQFVWWDSRSIVAKISDTAGKIRQVEKSYNKLFKDRNSFNMLLIT